MSGEAGAGRPVGRVRIDRLVLRGVDEAEVGDLSALVAEELGRPRDLSDGSDGSAPLARGPSLGRSVARRVAGVVSRKAGER